MGRRLLLFNLVLVLGCDRTSAAPSTSTSRDRGADPAGESPSRVAEKLGVDASEVMMPIDPAPPAGDLRAEIDTFTTLDACVSAHAALDPLVGDAIRAIGYETFLRDACRMLAAAKEKDAKRCDAIDASGLRTRCQAVVAIVAGAADGCPFASSDRPEEGRDPTCVAVASRDARLCAGEAREARGTCEALATGDEARCAGAKGDASATSNACRREAKRWKRVIDAPAKSGRPLAEPEAKLTLRGEAGTADPPNAVVDISSDVARGVVFRGDLGGAHTFDVGRVRERGATLFAPTPSTRTRLAATVRIDAKKNASIDHLEIGVPGAGMLVYPGVRCDCTVDVTKADAARGGEVKLTLRGVIGVAPHAYKVEANVTTFVRDVTAR